MALEHRGHEIQQGLKWVSLSEKLPKVKIAD